MTFYHRIYACILMVFLAAGAAADLTLGGHSGIEIESTRVIYPEKVKNGVAFTVTNNTTETYLLQSRVLLRTLSAAATTDVISSDTDPDTVESPVSLGPFIVIPPLESFEPGRGVTLRILLAENRLPKDRESVFVLAIKAIPQQSTVGVSNDQLRGQMVLALQNNLKLFYRPKGLQDLSSDERSQRLQFSLQGKILTINNPTPYFLTLNHVYADTLQVSLGNRRMIAPFSRESYEIDKSNLKTVSWQIIDDNGIKGVTKFQNIG